MGKHTCRGRPALDHMVGKAGSPGGGAPPVPFDGADELIQRGGGRQFPLEVGADPVDPH